MTRVILVLFGMAVTCGAVAATYATLGGAEKPTCRYVGDV